MIASSAVQGKPDGGFAIRMRVLPSTTLTMTAIIVPFIAPWQVAAQQIPSTLSLLIQSFVCIVPKVLTPVLYRAVLRLTKHSAHSS